VAHNLDKNGSSGIEVVKKNHAKQLVVPFFGDNSGAKNA